VGLLAGLGLVAITFGYWQASPRAAELAADDRNLRVVEAARFAPRGRILDRTGAVLAHSEETPQGFARRYSEPSLVHTTGFHSLRFGRTNLEAAFDGSLSGRQSLSPLATIANAVLHLTARPDDVVITVDRRIHLAAIQAMGDAPGAVVALDPRSGAVLTLAAQPYFDPNTADAQMADLQDDPRQPLFSRAIQATYVPGSTFKAVTATAALDRNLVDLQQPFACTRSVRVEQYALDCRNSQHLPRLTYKQAFAWSSNRVFGLTGLLLTQPRPINPWLDDAPPGDYPWEQSRDSVAGSAQVLEAYAQRFGFGRRIPFDLEVAESHLKGPATSWSAPLLAQTAFGQGEIEATPLQMALVAAAIANRGRVPEPYLVAEVRTQDGRVRRLHPDRVSLSQAMSEATAVTLVDFMVEGVERGYAAAAAIPNDRVGGKTGTAELGDGSSHSWFIGFAPADEPRIAIAVVGERRGSGSVFATNVAQRVLSAALEVYPP
jgi:peptidoglycan glycosyltransferase